MSIQMHVDSDAWGVQSGQVGILPSSLIKSMWLLVNAGLPLELRPLGQQSIRSQEQEAKILLVFYQGLVVNDATPFSTP